MSLAVGIDVAKLIPWAKIKITETGTLLASRRVDNTPEAIGDLIEQIQQAEAEHGPATVGIDILGGIAALLEAMLLAAGLRVVHVPGLAVNPARRGTTGGERKSDPKDAKVIADQIRMRDDLRQVTAMREQDVELRLLTSRRSELVTDATRRAARLRDLLTCIHPGLERLVEVTSKTGLHLLTRYVTPAEIRAAGSDGLLAHLRTLQHAKDASLITLAQAATASAWAQQVSLPTENAAAALVKDLAGEALTAKDRIKDLDQRIAAVLARHPDAALIRSLPGMGAILTAEFLTVTGGIGRFATADRLASAAGLAPVLKQSGKVGYQQRPTAGDKTLKRVIYQSAFIIACAPASKAFYQRKHTEGTTHHEAVIALARRRVNVLHAILRNRTPYDADYIRAA